MAEALRRLIVGNWKMNAPQAGGAALAADVAARVRGAETLKCDVVLCPPAVHLSTVIAVVAGGDVAVGAQDCHAEENGAHTGDLSAEMLAGAGCAYVLVGHSERRADHGESDTMVLAKAQAAHRAGLTAIVCVGESAAERDANATLEVVACQVAASLPAGATAANTVVAYEPVWAIGSGRTPTAAEIGEVHRHLRACLAAALADAHMVRLLYGGSVKADNAADLLAADDVNGALVGGASLDANAFWGIIAAA
jgi:triosephosphate isomerase